MNKMVFVNFVEGKLGLIGLVGIYPSRIQVMLGERHQEGIQLVPLDSAARIRIRSCNTEGFNAASSG